MAGRYRLFSMLFAVCIIVDEKVLKMVKSTERKKIRRYKTERSESLIYATTWVKHTDVTLNEKRPTHTYVLQDSTHATRRDRQN